MTDVRAVGESEPDADAVRKSVDAGLAFLVDSALPSGSWDMTCRVEGTDPASAHGLFSTSAVLLSVGDWLPRDVVTRATDFLQSCRNESGHWFFDAELGVPDDADDTACSLAALARYCPDATSAADVDLLLSYWRTPSGPFRTWHPSSDALAEFWSFASTDDAIVNCNVLFALTALGFTPTSDMVNSVTALLRETTSTRYYCGLSPIFYASARVGLATELNESLQRRRPTPDWNSLQTSNWMCARPEAARDVVAQLIHLQSDDGGWADDEWCTGNIVPPTVWGSRAASTAFAIEALLVSERDRVSRA